jgi:hypothetical protein
MRGIGEDKIAVFGGFLACQLLNTGTVLRPAGKIDAQAPKFVDFVFIKASACRLARLSRRFERRVELPSQAGCFPGRGLQQEVR